MTPLLVNQQINSIKTLRTPWPLRW